MRTGKIGSPLCLIAGLAVGLAGCANESFEVLAGEERATETAEDIVAQITEAYSVMFWEGEVFPVALDASTLRWVEDPVLRDGFRHVGEMLPEEAPWVLEFVDPTFIEGDTTFLLVAVYDFYHPHLCCKVMSATLVPEDGGWRLTGVEFGGWSHETDEGFRERLERGAEMREKEGLR